VVVDVVLVVVMFVVATGERGSGRHLMDAGRRRQ
jgi:hypothetical protein